MCASEPIGCLDALHMSKDVGKRWGRCVYDCMTLLGGRGVAFLCSYVRPPLPHARCRQCPSRTAGQRRRAQGMRRCCNRWAGRSVHAGVWLAYAVVCSLNARIHATNMPGQKCVGQSGNSALFRSHRCSRCAPMASSHAVWVPPNPLRRLRPRRMPHNVQPSRLPQQLLPLRLSHARR